METVVIWSSWVPPLSVPGLAKPPWSPVLPSNATIIPPCPANLTGLVMQNLIPAPG
ncbi:hypothetical protein VFPPC_17369 [Pochonia chlamydosporia 170]|uniref:Uncharacterized protein n=1 Tax=Pochonia chlamydosporia 170 TaxID=1380566 RepID=A0A219AS65_METCM|nr:hypothetical protein VFPPC_17369 [Pochonia chlamydosporia 170]OWT43482.1 hypothetical protein VFPPC_17369 [Pochonia chlamydosporia 170]